MSNAPTIKCESYIGLPVAAVNPEHAVRKAEFDVLAAAVAEIEGRISDAGISIEYSGDYGQTWTNTDFIDTSIPGIYRVTIQFNNTSVDFLVRVAEE